MPVARSESPRAANVQPAEPEFLITRVFDAPRALVFRSWIEPAHLARWSSSLERLEELMATNSQERIS